MELAGLAILIIFSLVGFVAIFFTTFGTLIIFIGSVLYAFLTYFSIITVKTVAILFTLYLSGEVLEYIFIIVGAKKFGASNAAVIGALIGGIVGAFGGAVFLGVGIIIGTFLGIFLGAFLVELVLQKDLIASLKAGAGGVIGRVGSMVVKVFIALAMVSLMVSRIVGAL
jgi:uncharacterized protein YqgC (DUF456 family)